MVVKVIDDVVSKGYQNLIENTLSSDNFDWNYITGLTFDDDSYTGFVKRIFFKDYEFRTPDTDLLLPLLYEAIDKYEKGLEIKELYRIIARMNLRGQNKSKHLPHVDLEYPHYTMVYYVNDSDGYTYIFDKMFDQSNPDQTKFGEYKTVKPVKGRAVFFNGLYYHAGSSPIKDQSRTIINADLVN